jgi:hypothetical protein
MPKKSNRLPPRAVRREAVKKLWHTIPRAEREKRNASLPNVWQALREHFQRQGANAAA